MQNGHSPATPLFHPEAVYFMSILDDLSSQMPPAAYEFMDNELFSDLLRKDRTRGAQIYWTEMLYRAHIAAVTTVFRAQLWTRALRDAAGVRNLFGTAASLRGLFESCADSLRGLGDCWLTLAEAHDHIRLALRGKAVKLVLAGKLEDTLIHYAHARRLERGESAPDSHRAASSKELLDEMKAQGVDRAHELYAALCELTHPASTTVSVFHSATSDGKLMLDYARAGSHADDLLATYKVSLRDLLMTHVNPAVLTLAVLNRLTVGPLRTPYVDRLNLAGIGGWKKVQAAMGL